MSDAPPPFIAAFNQAVKDAEIFLFITRDSELQKAACRTLEELLAQIAAEKARAIAQHDENHANLLLGCQCVAKALIAELRMWLLLKEQKPEQAWDELVRAQMASVDAARAHEGFRHLEEHNGRLEAIEQLVFPAQVFMSSGLIVRVQECSICGGDYEDCEHLAGKPYMGEFCYIVARDMEFDHAAIVEHPADKTCRVQTFSVEGGNRNRMTWQIEPGTDGKKENPADKSSWVKLLSFEGSNRKCMTWPAKPASNDT